MVFTPEEQQTLQQLRGQCSVLLETQIKQMEGGYLLSTVERFVNEAGTIIAQATHTKICAKDVDVPNEIFNIYVGVPTTQEALEAKVEYLHPVGADTEGNDDPARIG